MKTDSELRESIRLRCKSVIAALDDCPKPGLPFSRQKAKEIGERAGQTDTTREDLCLLDSSLDELIKQLQVTEDANGEKVLGHRRWEKFFNDATWDT